jgi:hypothetical protein
MNRRMIMRSTSLHPNQTRVRRPHAGIVCACVLTLAFCLPLSAAGTQPAAAAVQQKVFDSYKQAADALIQAAEQADIPALIGIFGEDGRDLVESGDVVQTKHNLAAFAAKAKEKTTLTPDPKNKKVVILSVGVNDWPMPIPIVKEKGKWRFDTKAGRQEILYRRIGGNELDAIQICRGFVEAQHEYALQRHDGSEVNQYAQRIISTPGKHDGLAWQNPDGTWGGPVGEDIAQAIAEGYSDQAKPYHGYYYKVLEGQGPAAPLGELNFVIKGVMIGGFALVAAPADYGVTGVKSFIVSHDGVVYEKDLGPDSLKIFKEMELFNPDATWHPVPED